MFKISIFEDKLFLFELLVSVVFLEREFVKFFESAFLRILKEFKFNSSSFKLIETIFFLTIDFILFVSGNILGIFLSKEIFSSILFS